MVRMMVSIDEEIRDRAKPILRREGLTISSFLRKSLSDFCETHESRKNVLKIDEIEAIR